jgi:hypothetical protein
MTAVVIGARVAPPSARAGEILESEPNDVLAMATAIGQGQFGRGVITYTPVAMFYVAEFDFWKTPVEVGDLVFAYVDAQDSSGFKAAYLSVVLKDGTLLEFDPGDGTPSGSLAGGAAVAGAVASQAGDLYYLVNGQVAFSATSISPYRLYQAVVRPSENAAEAEPNDTPATANPLTARMMTGTVSGSDVDFYKVFVQAGQRLVVIMDDNPDDDGTYTDTELSILATDGTTTLATGNNVGYGGAPGSGDANAAGAVVVPATGVYLIRVAHGGEGAALDTDYRFVVLVDGVAVVDRDTDGVPDALDGCPDDPAKSAPGQCGCGVADTDSDGDSVVDCNDGCPIDPAKTAPGNCGCGFAETTNCSGGSATGTGAASCGTCGNGAPTMLSMAAMIIYGARRRRARCD